MGNSRNSYLIKNTIIFTLGNLGSKLISFFLIPLYTNALTTAEYGVVDLVATVGTVAVPLLTLNICESVMRFALDKDANTRKITQIGTGILLIGMMVANNINEAVKMHMVITFIINKVWLIKIFDNFGTCCVNNMTTITSQDAMVFKSISSGRKG